MRPYKTVIFIFSVIALLAVVCVFFPREGVKIGDVTLSFPHLADMLGSTPDSTAAMPEISAEELLAQQLEQTRRMEEESQFLEFFKTSDIRFYLPGDSLDFFDDLFAAFDAADSTHVGIVHYGDSQLEEDRMTGVIRATLQDSIGGMGPGLLPLVPLTGNMTEGQSISGAPSTTSVFAPGGGGAGGKYGPLGQVAFLNGTATMSVWPRPKEAKRSNKFSRVTVFAENPSAALSATCRGETKTLEPGSGLRRITFNFADSLERVSLTLSGTANVYGVAFDGKHGVQMDNVAMRGCSGTIFTLISSYLLRDYFKAQNVKLVILQFGGNSVPYLSGEKSIHNYADQIRRQIRHVQELAPDAKVLFIGPSDMSTRIDGEWRTYPKLPLVVDSLRAAANDMGAAYWDLYQVMGGYNSMAQWCESSPLLAGSDHIHFTPRGAERVAGLFCKS
ncbi:MAG: hypothetical protein J6U33_06520, partial [Paludibacteraceae bacterium]|nr:hypothetical protein [Paludibacteraceae bacterium]